MRHNPGPLRHRWMLLAGLLSLATIAFGCATPGPAPPTPQPPAAPSAPATAELRDLRVSVDNGVTTVFLMGSDSLKYTVFKAIDPLRVVIELPNTVAAGVPPVVEVENEAISKIETLVLTQQQPTTRVEIGLNHDVAYEVDTSDQGVLVRFQRPASPVEAAVAAEKAVAQEEAAPAAEVVVYPPQPATSGAEAAPPSPASPAAEIPAATTLTAVQTIPEPSGLRVVLLADGSLSAYRSSRLFDPDRIVLDFPGLDTNLTSNEVPVQSDLVSRVRLGRSPERLRMVFDLKDGANTAYEVNADNNSLVISFTGTTAGKITAPAAAAPEVVAAASPEAPARIKSIDFTMLESGDSRLQITAAGAPQPEVQITGPDSISLLLRHATLPSYLQRHLDTTQFPSAVDLIDPRPAPGDPSSVEVRIKLREMVPYHLSRSDGNIILDFEPSAVPPRKPIELGPPVTVAEARAPAAELSPAPAAPAPEPSQPQAEAKPEAAAPAATQEAPAPEAAAGAATQEEGPRYTGQPISLDLQDVDITNVLRLLADVTGKNLVVEPDVKGRVTLKVEKVPWDQVLDLILKINNLDKEIEGNVIRIATAEKIRTERENRLALLKAEQERLVEARDAGPIITEYLQVNYSDAQEISNQLEKIRSEKGSIAVDERTNLIIYSDYQKRIQEARALLQRLDRPTPQVMIEARIVEASSNFSRDLGIQWGGSYTAGRLSDDLGGTTTIQGLLGGSNFAVDAPVGAIGSIGLNFARTAGLSLLNLDLRLSALETAGEVRLVSSPRIYTLDNVEASIQQGEQIPYPQQSEDGISTAFVAATLSLTVTPHVTPDDKVRLEVTAKNDFADFGRTVNGSPAINTREAKTELLVNNGDTIVIGGIVKQDRSWSESRVPFLSRIPLLSWLFKSRQVSDNKSELLIFLSPTIIKEPRVVGSST